MKALSPAGEHPGAPLFRRLPGTVWALGLVSLCMDVSSEIIHSLLPVFLVSSLGAGAGSVGIIEGVAEATAMIGRVFSGVLSDRLGRRKALAVAGYGLGALSKPLFALAPGIGTVFAARFIDRIGKGVRGAPRDALIADVTPAQLRGAAYGLRQSLDSVGAFAGPLLAVMLMHLTGSDFRAVFWMAVVPGAAAVVILLLAVREPARAKVATVKLPLGRAELVGLGRRYWQTATIGTLFTLARFSEAFLLLRAVDVGMAADLVPMVYVAMNLVFSLSAYPAGYLSDRVGRAGLMGGGLAVLIGADLLLAAARGPLAVLAGVICWGLHLGLTQGLLAAWIADAVAAELRGTAFGVFGLLSGCALLAASLLAGLFWERLGPEATFLAGGGFATCALAGFLFLPTAGKRSA